MSSMNINTYTILNRRTVLTITIVTAALPVLANYFFRKWKKPNIPTQWTPVGTVTTLCIYPLKSGRRIEVDHAECTQQGLQEVEMPDETLRLRDRQFVVYHEQNHEFRTARQYPRLVLVEIEGTSPDSVVVIAPGIDPLFIEVPSRNEHNVVCVKHFKKEIIESLDCGDEAAFWISKYLLGKENGLRLGYHDGQFKRNAINTIYKEEIHFYGGGLRNESSGLNSDLAAIHLINSASVADVNEKMGNSEITVFNFRPTLVVSGSNLIPFEEDNWEWIKVGDVIMKNVLPCFRCIMTTIDQEKGVRRPDREPLKTLEKYRIMEGPSKTPAMGILLEVFQTGVISVDDIVYVGK